MARNDKKETQEVTRKIGRPKVNPLAAVPNSLRLNPENPILAEIHFTDGTALKCQASEVNVSSGRCYITIKRGFVVRTITIPMERVCLITKDEIPGLASVPAQGSPQPSQELVQAEVQALTGQRDPTNLTPDEIQKRLKAFKKTARNMGKDFYKKDGPEQPEPMVTVNLSEAIR